MNAKTILNKFLSTTLIVALLFSLSPLAATATEPETADAATATDASTAPAVSADTPDDTADTPTPQYTKDDYTYMYLVTEKKYTYLLEDNNGYKEKRYDSYVYSYDEYGMISGSVRDSDLPEIVLNKMKIGESTYYYDNSGNLIKVDGPYFDFSYYYKNNRIIKYNMACAEVIVGHNGPNRFKHKLKYRKKDKRIYNPGCPGVSLLSRKDYYFFNKKHKPVKVRSGRRSESWYLREDSYKYDKKGNVCKLVTTRRTSENHPSVASQSFFNL